MSHNSRPLGSTKDNIINKQKKGKREDVLSFFFAERTILLDNVLGLLFAIGFIAVILAVPEFTILRILLFLPFFLFVHGYYFVLYLWPETSSCCEKRLTGINRFERLVLSLVMSVGITTAVGTTFYYAGFDFLDMSFAVSMLILLLILMVLAHKRRIGTTLSRRFIPVIKLPEWFHTDSSNSQALKITTVLLIAAGLVSVGYANYVLDERESFSVLYITGEDGYVSSIPKNITLEENYTILINIENNELENMQYILRIGIRGFSDLIDIEDQGEVHRLDPGVGYYWEFDLDREKTISREFNFYLANPGEHMVRLQLLEAQGQILVENYFFVEVVE